LSLWSPDIFDDRERVVRLVPPFARGRANRDTATDALVANAESATSGRPPRTKLALWLVIGSFVVAGVFLVFTLGPYTGTLRLLGSAIGIPGVIWVFLQTRRHNAPRVAREYVARGLCGSCAYRVTDLPPEPDGCVVCPECGAAWRVVDPPGNVIAPSSTVR
jgi:hypothetical protein